MNTKVLILATLTSILGIAATQSLAASLPRLQFVTGEVQVIDLEGKRRPIIKGEVLLPGEKLTTGPDGMAQLKVFGQGVIALRESSEIELMPLENDQYVISLDKGLIRTVTLLPGDSGNITIQTPEADIRVTAGDNQTAINKAENGEQSTINQVLAGNVNIKVAGVERNSKVGSVVQIASVGRNVVTLPRTPGFMRLRVPPNTRPGNKGLANNSASSRLQTASLNAERGITSIKVGEATVPIKPGPVSSFVPPRIKDPVNTTKYDRIKFIKLEIASGTADIRTAINDANFALIESPYSKDPLIVPIESSDPKVLANFNNNKETVYMTPTPTSITGATAFSSDKIRDVRVLLYDPVRLQDPDKTLSNTVKDATTTRCVKCVSDVNVSIFTPPKKK